MAIEAVNAWCAQLTVLVQQQQQQQREQWKALEVPRLEQAGALPNGTTVL